MKIKNRLERETLNNDDFDNTENIIEFMKTGVEEYDGKNGYVSIEMAIHKKDLDFFIEFSDKIKSKIGVWVAFKCEACEEYRGKNYIHVELKRKEYIRDDEEYLYIQKGGHIICVKISNR
jgi:hypothetical protein